jgi:hypothetical protein
MKARFLQGDDVFKECPMTKSRSLRAAFLIFAAAIGAGASAEPPSPTMAAITRDGSHDFDFDFGVWHTEITRTLDPFSDSSGTIKLSGTVTIRKIWGGKAQIEEIEADGPNGHWQGMSLFLYDPAARQWSQTFVGSSNGVITGSMIGSFKDGKGELYQQDTLDGRSILVRATWSDITPTSHSYREDYSADGGKTWRLSFLAKKTKIADTPPPAPDNGGWAHEGSGDFDFTFGTWTEHSRRLLRPLTGSTQWVEWDGRTIVRKIWGGKANIAELTAVTPSGAVELIALRVYNPATQQWALNFATSAIGKLNDVTAFGSFKNGRIDFYNQEPLNGRSILVRFSVYPTSPTTHVSEQAFSADGGKTWEVNWINRYTLESRETEPKDR